MVGGIAAASETAPETPRDQLEKVLRLAASFLQEMVAFRDRFRLALHLRIGVHTGEVVTGFVGTQRIRFCKSANVQTCDVCLYAY